MGDYRTLVGILADFINKEASQIEASAELVDYANKHKVSAIVSYQIAPQEVAKKLCLTECIVYLQRQGLEREMCKILTEAGIPYFFVKGTAISAFYPIPALRTMGDSDLVVKDREKAKLVLENYGYQFWNTETSDWHFRKNGLHFELHSQLLYGGMYNSPDHVSYFNRCWDYVENNELDWNFHFLFVLEHLRKHLVWEGVGFRQFMDLAILMKYRGDQFDWNWIRGELEQLELFEFARTCMTLINKWFRVAIPYDMVEFDDTFYEWASQKILENGVFGFDSDKYKSETEREIYLNSSSDDLYLAAVAKRVIRRCFPAYEEMVAWPQYQFIENKKYLLPIGWIYRLVRNLFRVDKWKKNAKWAYLSKDNYEKYNTDMKKWGL